MTKSYIGITGFMSPHEVATILRLVPESTYRRIMIGVLASRRTLDGLTEVGYSNRYPAIETIARIFPRHARVFNVVHYYSRKRETLLEQLFEITRVAGTNLHGLQLNISWPSPETLERYRAAHPYISLILSIGSSALAKVSGSPEALTLKLAKEYQGMVDFVLLDQSGGQARPFDAEHTHSLLSAIEQSGLGAGLVIAGGLSAATLNLASPFLGSFPDLSVDAEGMLRDRDDHLDLNLAADYVRKGLEMFLPHKSA